MAPKTLSERLEIVNRFKRQIPVDVSGLASQLGAPVREAFLHPKISGMLEKTGEDSYSIVVNQSDSETRQRFTIAHEIGHLLAHSHLIGEGVDDDRAYRSTAAGKYHNTAIGRLEETEANKLAAAILMPSEAVESLKMRFGKDAERLAKEFNVSEHAMSIRLGIPFRG